MCATSARRTSPACARALRIMSSWRSATPRRSEAADPLQPLLLALRQGAYFLDGGIQRGEIFGTGRLIGARQPQLVKLGCRFVRPGARSLEPRDGLLGLDPAVRTFGADMGRRALGGMEVCIEGASAVARLRRQRGD